MGATGNEEYHLGDYSKAGLSKAKSGVETVVQRATGNEEYQFGDYSKALASKAKSGVEAVGQQLVSVGQQIDDVSQAAASQAQDVDYFLQDVASKAKSGVETVVQQTGDYSKAAASKIETGIQRATGNEEYHLGDYSKAGLSKAKSGVETLICRATGTEESADSTK